MKRALLSFARGFGLVVLMFGVAVILIRLSGFNPIVVQYSTLPFRLPYLFANTFIPRAISNAIFVGRVSATVYVYALNGVIYAIPIYYILGAFESKRNAAPIPTEPPPPPAVFEKHL